MNDQQLLRYSHHILLDEIGIVGQQRLLEAKALIIGLDSSAAVSPRQRGRSVKMYYTGG